jgi:ferredoxin
MLCAEVAPNYWVMQEDGLAQLRAITKIRQNLEWSEGFEEDRNLLQEAEEGCPVDIIKVVG